MDELKKKVIEALNEYKRNQEEQNDQEEIEYSKYADLELLGRLLIVASACPEFRIQGNHLAGLADLLLKCVEVTKQKEPLPKLTTRQGRPKKGSGLKPI